MFRAVTSVAFGPQTAVSTWNLLWNTRQPNYKVFNGRCSGEDCKHPAEGRVPMAGTPAARRQELGNRPCRALAQTQEIRRCNKWLWCHKSQWSYVQVYISSEFDPLH